MDRFSPLQRKPRNQSTLTGALSSSKGTNSSFFLAWKKGIRSIYPAILATLLVFSKGNATEKNTSYLQDRIPKSNFRYETMLKSLNLLTERKARILLETGTARYGAENFAGDGGSTIIFSEWAQNNQATLYSVDISQEYLTNAKEALDSRVATVFVESDSVEFLEKFDRSIDFLYLDSYDYEYGNVLPSQLHHLNEIVAAYPHLHEHSIVMVDDCDLPHGGKGKFVINFLIARGWKVIADKYQVILVRESSLNQ